MTEDMLGIESKLGAGRRRQSRRNLGTRSRDPPTGPEVLGCLSAHRSEDRSTILKLGWCAWDDIYGIIDVRVLSDQSIHGSLPHHFIDPKFLPYPVREANLLELSICRTICGIAKKQCALDSAGCCFTQRLSPVGISFVDAFSVCHGWVVVSEVLASSTSMMSMLVMVESDCPRAVLRRIN